MFKMENFEKYIIQPHNVCENSIKRHLLENELLNDFVNIEEWILFLQKEQRESLQIWIDFLNNRPYSEEIKKRKWYLESLFGNKLNRRIIKCITRMV